MTNAFTRGLRRLFGSGPKPKKPSYVDCKPVKLEDIAFKVEDKALTVNSQDKVVAKKKSVKKVPSKKKSVKKVANKKVTAKKKPATKKTVKKVSKKK